MHKRHHRPPARAEKHTDVQGARGRGQGLCDLLAGGVAGVLADDGGQRGGCGRAREAQAVELALVQHVDARRARVGSGHAHAGVVCAGACGVFYALCFCAMDMKIMFLLRVLAVGGSRSTRGCAWFFLCCFFVQRIPKERFLLWVLAIGGSRSTPGVCGFFSAPHERERTQGFSAHNATLYEIHRHASWSALRWDTRRDKFKPSPPLVAHTKVIHRKSTDTQARARNPFHVVKWFIQHTE